MRRSKKQDRKTILNPVKRKKTTLTCRLSKPGKGEGYSPKCKVDILYSSRNKGGRGWRDILTPSPPSFQLGLKATQSVTQQGDLGKPREPPKPKQRKSTHEDY